MLPGTDREGDWRRRHGVVRAVLVGAAGLLLASGLLGPLDGGHVAIDVAPLLLCAALSGWERASPRSRSVLASLGLMGASAMTVHLAGGRTEAHFTYFVLLGVLGLYEDWLPYATAVVFVILQHGVMGSLRPEAMWGAAAEGSSSWHLTIVHGVAILAASVVAFLSWRWHEATRAAGERRLVESEMRLAALVEHGSGQIALLDPEGRVRWASPTMRAALGADAADPIGRPMVDLIHPDDLDGSLEAGRRAAAVPGGVVTFDCRCLALDGSWRWVEAILSNRLHDEAVRGFVLNTHDITERVLAAARLSHQATHDQLTGLPNRTLMEDRLLQARASAIRHGEVLAALFVDLDHFKAVNDTYGHAVGDQLLVAVAERLRSTARVDDTVVRVGGDEFVVLAVVGDVAEAQLVAARVTAAFDETFALGDLELAATASIGLATSVDADDCIDLLAAADLALYEAKAGGRGTWAAYAPAPDSGEAGPRPARPGEWQTRRARMPAFDQGRLADERALSEQYRQHIAESSQAIVVHVDRVIVCVSRGALHLFSLEEAASLVGRSIYDLVVPESLDRARARQASIDAGGWPGPDRITVAMLDGTPVEVEVSSTPALWDGRLGSQVTLRPVEDRWAEIVRLGGELTASGVEALIMADLDFTIVAWSEGAAEVYGWAAEEVLGLPVKAVIPWAGTDVELAASRRSMEATGSWEGRARQRRRDGTIVAVDALVRIIHDAAGAPIGVVSRNRLVDEPGAAADRELLHDLELAIDRDEIQVAYQPIVDRSGTVTKVEALVRWAHPVHGLLPPATFVPVAERHGLIGAVDRVVLRRACEQVAAWRADAIPDLELSVNISGHDLEDPELVERVVGALDASGLPARCLWLEVTETALAHDSAVASERLAHLGSLGVRIALDDFGTGFATLAQLHRLPVHALKIDRMFVDAITDTDGDDVAIVRSVLALGRELGLEVIAEGVETDAQRSALDGLGCRLFQGYLYSAPALPAPTPEWLPCSSASASGTDRSAVTPMGLG